jgi:hypothetical protein
MSSAMFLAQLEHKCQPLISRFAFIQRLGRCFLFASALIFISLVLGMLGYHGFEHMKWIDAFDNAAMILSGMGPLSVPQSWWGKLFAGVYALYSGLVLIIATGMIVAPIFHRLMHRFHLESAAEGE